MDYKNLIAQLIKIDGVSREEIASSVGECQDKSLADYTLPCFKFSKLLKKSPATIASELVDKIEKPDFLSNITAVNGYLNFKIDDASFSRKLLEEVLECGCRFGASSEGQGRTVCVDYSSVNIAKPFHIGHLSTTVIGAALARIYRHLGYEVVSINHLGDWGTQFGKLIVALRKWGDRKTIEAGGIREMLKIYVRFHEEAETHPELEDEARAWFKKIEDGDGEALSIFEWFKEITLKEVRKVYDVLGVQFDSYAGESFYNDKMQPILDELSQKGLLTESEGAKVVDLSAYDMPPCLLVKADGATLYATRDLAAAEYRKKTYDFYKCLYVVAYQQNLHFKQVFRVLQMMGREWAKDLVHVPFGMVSFEGASLSTRKGNVVFLQDVLDKCTEKALAIISEKSPELENKEEVAKKVGVGAVIFSALHTNKIKDISFRYDRVLNFDGETGPYVQYTYARCNSVMKKAKISGLPRYDLITPTESLLLKQIYSFKETVKAAAEQYEPSLVTRLMVDIAKSYNKFYYEERIINSDQGLQNFRLMLTEAAMITLKTGLGLIGMEVPEKM